MARFWPQLSNLEADTAVKAKAYVLFFCWILAGFISASADTKKLWIDVRSLKEYQAGHIAGDIHIPFRQITQLIDQYAESKDAEIKLYCEAGVRASIAKFMLQRQGYSNVENVINLKKARKIRGLE